MNAGHGHSAWSAVFATRPLERRRGRLTQCGKEAYALAAKIAAEHGFTLARLQADDRRRPVVAARWAAIRALDALGRYSGPSIGRVFGMDHTSVFYALGRLNKRRPSAKGAA